MLVGIMKNAEKVEIVFFCEDCNDYKYYSCSHMEYNSSTDSELEARAMA